MLVEQAARNIQLRHGVDADRSVMLAKLSGTVGAARNDGPPVRDTP